MFCSRLLREVLDGTRATHGASHPEVAETLHELGRLARRRGELQEAESRLGEALAMRRKVLGEQPVMTAESLAALAAAADGFAWDSEPRVCSSVLRRPQRGRRRQRMEDSDLPVEIRGLCLSWTSATRPG